MRRMTCLTLALASCVSPPLETPKGGAVCQPEVEFNQSVRNKADILFMVDNSGSMKPMSEQLKARFQEFLKVFIDRAEKQGQYADLHIGVVTSDYGAGNGNNSCGPSPGGQLGKLQAVGRAADINCKPPMGANFIAYQFTADGTNPNNLPTGQDLETTFKCMSSVVTEPPGCGFEHQLESVYAALHNNLPENEGFLRDEALLAVVFVTNEDDASAPPASDVYDKSLVSKYGCMDSYSRQTRLAVVCCPPGRASCAAAEKVPPPDGSSGGLLAGCEPAPTGTHYGVDRYIDFFTRPRSAGGVKADPNDVILVAIDAPDDPFQVILSNPSSDAVYVECPQAMGNCTCAPVLQRSCINPQDPHFFGDPPIRLNKVVRAAKTHTIASICDNDFSAAMQQVADAIVSILVPGCLSFDPTDQPDCVVEDVTVETDGSKTVKTLEQCSDPPAVFPCWRVDTRAECAPVSPTMKAVTIDRNGQVASPHTRARVVCGIGC